MLYQAINNVIVSLTHEEPTSADAHVHSVAPDDGHN